MFNTCVVFDLDDTLYLERDYVRSGFKHVAEYADRNLGTSDFAEHAWRLFTEGRRGTIFNNVLQEQNIPCGVEIIEHLVSVYRSHRPNIRLQTDAACCLDKLAGHASLAMITDGPIESQRNKIAALQLERRFACIVVTEELGKEYRKPSLSAFRIIEEKEEFRNSRFCYVADNPQKDFVAPRQLGWKTIRIRRKEGLYAEFDMQGEGAADTEVADLTGVPSLLQQLTKLAHWEGSQSDKARVHRL
jgi:putative hydrolase of the HAD superfamily